MSKVFAVAGNPVLHSKSPELFNSIFESRNIDAIYTRLAASNAEEIAKTIKEIGIDGLNITSPFKEEIIPFLDEVKEDAMKINAVNTIVNKEGKLIGYNSDFIGVGEALKNNRVEVQGKKVIILGAGGAARAAVYAVKEGGAKEVVIVNRSLDKAEEASKLLNCGASPIEELENELKDADILISCLLKGVNLLENIELNKELLVFDANYGHSPLIEQAKKSGCKTIDGINWLLYQAVPVVELFTGERVDDNSINEKILEEKRVKKPNIALIGFMGSGKTTIAQELAKQSNREIIEIDEEIEKSSGMSIKEIFEQKGEEEFRKIEKSKIKQACEEENKIISPGGGAILEKENREIISKNCMVVWLHAPIKSCLERLEKIGGLRPPVDPNNPEQSANELFEKRKFLYSQLSDVIILTENTSKEEITKRINHEINKTFSG